MNIISVDSSNIDREHICCAISDKKGETCVSSKKAWMKSQFTNGLVFKRLDARGKVFIDGKGMVLYYTNQCPHTDKYAPLIAEIAKSKGQSIKLKKIESREQAQNAPATFTTYSFFYDGKFVTNEIFSESKFVKFLEEKGL